MGIGWASLDKWASTKWASNDKSEKLYGSRRTTENYFFDEPGEQDLPAQQTGFERYLAFFFLWSQNRDYRFERFGEIHLAQDYCRHRQELPRRRGFLAGLQRGVFGSGAGT